MSNCFYINGLVPPHGSKVMTKSVMRTVRGKSAVFALLQSQDNNPDYDVASYKLAGLLKDSHYKLISVSPESQNMAMDDFLIDANGEMSSFTSANSLTDYNSAAAILTVNKGIATVTNIGNVSCYHFRNGNFSVLTHVPEKKKIYAGTASVSGEFAVGGVISGENPTHFTSQQISVERDDIFLFCSSGITEYVSEDRISHILSLNLTDERSVQRIISEAIAMDSDKDMTVILVRNGGKPIRSKKLIKGAVLVSAAVIALAVFSAFFSSLLANLFKKPEISEEPSNSVIESNQTSEFILIEDPSNPIPPEPYTPPDEDEESETEEGVSEDLEMSEDAESYQETH